MVDYVYGVHIGDIHDGCYLDNVYSTFQKAEKAVEFHIKTMDSVNKECRDDINTTLDGHPELYYTPEEIKNMEIRDTYHKVEGTIPDIGTWQNANGSVLMICKHQVL
jgi:hypothetical protein